MILYNIIKIIGWFVIGGVDCLSTSIGSLEDSLTVEHSLLNLADSMCSVDVFLIIDVYNTSINRNKPCDL